MWGGLKSIYIVGSFLDIGKSVIVTPPGRYKRCLHLIDKILINGKCFKDECLGATY